MAVVAVTGGKLVDRPVRKCYGPAQMAARHELPRAELESLLDQPETYEQLLGDYAGPMSLGVSVDETTGEQCLLLRVADADVVRRRELDVHGHVVRVIVRSGYRQPVPG